VKDGRNRSAVFGE